VPTTALVIFAPLEYPRTGTPVAIMGANGRTSFQQSVGDNLSVEEEISKATWEEVLGGALPMWQTRIFVERWMTQQSTRPRDLLSVPARWVRGADVPIVIRGQWVTTPFGATTVLEAQKLATTGASWGRAMMVEWIPGAAGGNSITVPLKIIHSGRILYHRDLQFPIVLVDSDAELLEHLTDDASTALVKRALDVRLVRDEHGVDVVAGDRGDADPWDKIDFGLGFRVDVLFDGTPVGTGAGLVVWDYAVWKNYQEVQMNWVGDGLERVMREPGRSRFIVLGDPGAAGAQYRDFPFNKPRTAVWNGRFESPARIDPWRIPPRGAGG
jgi:hypothetical protein